MAFDAGAIESTMTIDRTPFQRGLQQARQEAERFTRDPINARLDVDTRRATTDIAGWRRRQEDRALALATSVDTASATAALSTWRTVQGNQTVRQRVEVDQDGLAQARGTLVLLSRDLSGFAATIGSATRASLGLSGALYGLGGAVPVLGQLGVAAGQLSQGMLLLPGGLAIAAAGMGTLMSATSGVSDAFGAVSKSQAAAGKSVEAQTAATEALNQAMGNLAPSAQEFVRQVVDLRDEFHNLRLIEQQHLFAGLGQEVKTLGGLYVPVLETGLSGVADAFNRAGKQVGAFLAESRTIEDFGALFGNTATTVDNLGLAFRPVLSGLRDIGTVGSEYLARVTGGADQATQRFAAWAAEARQSGELMTMFYEFGTVLSSLGSIAVNVGSIIGSVFSAMAQTGTGLLGSIQQLTSETALWLNTARGSQQLIDFFTTLQHVSNELQPAVSAVFAAIGGAIQTLLPVLPGVAENFANIVQAVTPLVVPLTQLAVAVIPPLVAAVSSLGPALPFVAAGFLGIATALRGLQALGNMGDFFTRIGAGFTNIRNSARTAGDATASFGSRLAGAATTLGAGVFGLAVTAGTIALGFLAAAQQKAADRAQAHREMVSTLSSALRESNGAIDENVRKQTAQQIQGDASYASFQKLGITLGQLTDVALGNGAAYDQVTGKLKGMQTTQQVVDLQTGITTEMMSKQGYAARDAQGRLDQLRTTYGDAAQKNRDLAAAMTGATVTMSPLQTAFQTLASVTANADQKTQAFNLSLDLLIGKNLGAAQSALSFQGTINSLTQAVGANGTTLDANTAAGQANRQAVLNSLQAALQHSQAVFQQTGDVNRARDALRQNEQALYDNAIRVFGNRDAVDTLLRSVGGLPGQYDQAARDAEGMAHRTNDALQGIRDKEIKVTATSSWFDTYLGIIRNPQVSNNSTIPLPLSRATGGPVAGPGTATSDSIPAMLSNGEYVINAASTRAHLPLIEAINQNRLAEGGQPIPFQKLAAGGPVGMDYAPHVGNIGGSADNWAGRVAKQFGDETSTNFGRLIAKQVMTYGGMSSSDPGGAGVQRWSNLVLQALSMLGQPAGFLGITLARMNKESGGNPRAINLWDSNAKRGTPSMGLMQVIQPTFNAHRDSRAVNNVWDPLANLLASMRYALSRYGSLPAAYNKAGGYDNGGELMPGYTMTYNGTGKPENVRTAAQEDELVVRLQRIETALSERPAVTVHQSFTGGGWEAEEAAAAGARHMTAALKELA